MRKIILIFFIQVIIFLPCVKSQDKFKGFYSGVYKEAQGDDDLSTVKKDFCIIYNESSCLLNLNGTTSVFRIKSYNKKISNNIVQESFSNNSAENYPADWFDITINKKQLLSNEITINLPLVKGGYFYYVENAVDISLDSNKKFKNLITKWRNYQNSFDSQEPDTLSIKELEEINYKDSMIALVIDSIYSIGDNYNQQQIKWVIDLIESVVKVKNGEDFYKDFKILIDANGYITQVFPVDRNDLLAKKYQKKISNAVLGIKLIPFKGTNGKYYPSYKTMYIKLLPE